MLTKNDKPIVTTWLRPTECVWNCTHNLIQFALEWYHVPEHIRKIIFNYYDELFIRVKTEEWTQTGFSAVSEYFKDVLYHAFYS